MAFSTDNIGKNCYINMSEDENVEDSLYGTIIGYYKNTDKNEEYYFVSINGEVKRIYDDSLVNIIEDDRGSITPGTLIMVSGEMTEEQATQFRENIGAISIDDIGTVFVLKGNVDTVGDLPVSGNSVGDVYYVKEDSVGYIWLISDSHPNGYWEELGKAFDIIVDSELSSTSTNPVQNKVINAALATKGTYSKPSSGIPKSDLASTVQTSLGKADTALQSVPSGYATETWVTNKGYGTYSKPTSGIPKSDLSSAIQTSLGKADTALQVAPVASVNGRTGVVVLGANDVGALPEGTVIPPTVTEQTVSGWGFTKNTGTYSKPNGGIPASDLAAGVIPDISGKANAADVYTKTEINQKLVGTMDYKGTKATVSALPTSGNKTGDVWHITADGSEWAWNGSAWEELGTAVDLSGYRTASAQDAIDSAQDTAIAAKYTKPSGGIPDSDIASAATWNAKGTYSKPSGGIPKIDLASAVQTSLGKADTALQSHQSLAAYRTATAQDTIDAAQDQAIAAKYTKPSGGIPKSDLSSAIQTSLGKADTALQSVPSTYRTASAQDIIDAAQNTAIANKLAINGNAYRTSSIPMGKVDSTSTATKFTATIEGITELRNGVCMWLTNGVITSASGFTVNINGLGAKPCYSSIAAATRSTTIFNTNYTLLMIYNEDRVTDGCWDIVYGIDTNTTYTPYSLGFGYGTSTTAEATIAKAASVSSSYKLVAGGIVSIKFTNDVPANSTLNINSKGAKAIYYRGDAITNGVIKGGDTATFIYSTYYHLISIDRDEKLPVVTTADNGKFLCVINGAWSSTTVPSAETISF